MTDLTRKQKREIAADNVCRELRYQIANNVADWQLLNNLLLKWFKISNKSKYKRPVQ
jgi:hypothetical protein